MGVVEFLIQMKKSDDEKLNKPCRGALWTLRTAMKQSDSKIYREYALQMEAARTWSKLHGRVTKLDKTTNGTEDKTNAPGHIMISYNSSDRVLMTTIRDRLRTCGYTVWMDVDQMTGSTTDAMAEAVENSLIVLICLSEKYKNSLYCRNEANYAYDLRKTIIPLKTARDYKPDGWLGFMCASKLFFDFSGKYPNFEEPMSKLLKEIESVYTQNAKDGQKATTHQVRISHSDTNPTPSTYTRLTEKTVKKWTVSEVHLWLQKYDLIGVLPDNITAGEIALLLRMQKECQEFFYKCVQEVLKVKGLLSMSKVVWALDEISS
ncbi:hypothetical protein DPMN_183000 [Dreissena polymorpha]|uniref:TIR domain-containing protein n=1 Tax=Dreissena polymorpha TaxID=45954 RepID=A0A9D4I567_DREPO|nr:hypothetical protein DPMN_183000 [Dreissena polymorpha]